MTETPRGLTAAQLELLLAPLHPSRVQHLKNQSHLEAWDVRRWLTRIFGFGGWSPKILSCDLVHELTWPILDDKGKPVPGKMRCTAVYRVTLSLTVRDDHGNVVGYWEDGATGDGVNQVSVGDAHDLALKTAMSQALKRCAVNLGDQFGLSLYNEGQTDAVVVRTVAHSTVPRPQGAEAAPDAPVTGGELHEQQPTPEDAADAVARKALLEAAEEQPARAGKPGGATKPQLTKITLLVRDKFGITERNDRLAKITTYIARNITSGNDLTFDEARHVINQFQKLPDAATPAEQPPTGGEKGRAESWSHRMAADRGTPMTTKADGSDQLAEDMLIAIADATNTGELEGLYLAAKHAHEAGKITDEQFRKLDELGFAKNADLRAAAGAAA